jgi:ribosomal protein S27AE
LIDQFKAEEVAIWTAIAEIAEFAAQHPGAPALTERCALYARTKAHLIEQTRKIDEECPRCGAGMQATHHWLCEAQDGTPSGLSDDLVRKLIAAD